MIHIHILQALLLSLLPSVALAQTETRLLGDDKDGARHFMLLSQMEAQGKNRIGWKIVNYPRRNAVGAQSNRTRQEFDCEDQRVRDLFVVWYSGTMASGTLVMGVAPESPDWRKTQADSIDERARQIACAAAVGP
ncbi:MAG: hypothetical protein RL320_594 [Pseudomonadota bacterium]